MLPLRSLVASLLPLLVGVIAHIRGLTVSDKAQADMANVVGLCFDLGAIILFWILKIHHDGLDALYNALQIHMADPGGHTDDATSITVPSLDKGKVITSAPIRTTVEETGTGRGSGVRGLVLLLALGSFSFVLTGCAPGTMNNPFSIIADPKALPADKLTAAETLYNSTMSILTIARQENKINDKLWHDIRIASDSFNAAMDSLKVQVGAGLPLDGNSLWVSANAALQTLISQKGTVPSGNRASSTDYQRPVYNLRGDLGEQRPYYGRPAGGDYATAA